MEGIGARGIVHFVRGARQTLGRVSPLSLLQMPAEVLVEEHFRSRRCHEREETRRRAIEAWQMVRTRLLDTQNAAMRHYLALRFAERAGVLDFYFAMIDRALEKEDDMALAMLMDSLCEQLRLSPLDGLEPILRALDDPQTKTIDFS